MLAPYFSIGDIRLFVMVMVVLDWLEVEDLSFIFEMWAMATPFH
jgi:hypothetical protein